MTRHDALVNIAHEILRFRHNVDSWRKDYPGDPLTSAHVAAIHSAVVDAQTVIGGTPDQITYARNELTDRYSRSMEAAYQAALQAAQMRLRTLQFVDTLMPKKGIVYDAPKP